MIFFGSCIDLHDTSSLFFATSKIRIIIIICSLKETLKQCNFFHTNKTIELIYFYEV